jgi:hypothetical protein
MTVTRTVITAMEVRDVRYRALSPDELEQVLTRTARHTYGLGLE